MGNRKRLKGDWCVYCGEPANTTDHFPPLSTGVKWGVLLPACFSCNAAVNARHPFNIHGRIDFIKSKLTARVKRPCLGREKYRERLAWNAVEYLRSIDHINYFALPSVEAVTSERQKPPNLKSLERSSKKPAKPTETSQEKKQRLRDELARDHQEQIPVASGRLWVGFFASKTPSEIDEEIAPWSA